MYRVTFDRVHEEPRQIATAQKFAEALAAARKAGALLHEGKGSGCLRCLRARRRPQFRDLDPKRLGATIREAPI